MTKAVFIATAEPYSGKSLVLLGLVNRLLGQARKVGYFKPIIDHDPATETDSKLALPRAVSSWRCPGQVVNIAVTARYAKS